VLKSSRGTSAGNRPISRVGKPGRGRVCHALAARKSDRYLSRLYDSHLAPTGLSVSQFAILGLLRVHGPLKICRVGGQAYHGADKLGSCSETAPGLGVVAAKRSDNDRAFDVALSPSGVEKFAGVRGVRIGLRHQPRILLISLRIFDFGHRWNSHEISVG
jgi:hypothetical protein